MEGSPPPPILVYTELGNLVASIHTFDSMTCFDVLKHVCDQEGFKLTTMGLRNADTGTVILLDKFVKPGESVVLVGKKGEERVPQFAPTPITILHNEDVFEIPPCETLEQAKKLAWEALLPEVRLTLENYTFCNPETGGELYVVMHVMQLKEKRVSPVPPQEGELEDSKGDSLGFLRVQVSGEKFVLFISVPSTGMLAEQVATYLHKKTGRTVLLLFDEKGSIDGDMRLYPEQSILVMFER